MPLMTWTNELSVSIIHVYSQHMKLVQLLNSLHDAMKCGKGKEVIVQTLSALVDYTTYHFSTEEALFAAHGYPDSLKHKKEHASLTKTALDLKERSSEGAQFLTSETMLFLKDWLNSHILGPDKKYGPFLNAKGVH